MDVVKELEGVLGRMSQWEITIPLVFIMMIFVIIVIAFVFIRISTSQITATKSQNDTLNKQLDYQSKQLDAFNRVANRVEALDNHLSLQNTRFTEYHNSVQQSLTTMTGALDTTLKNSTSTNATLDRIEKNGKKMGDELHGALEGLGEARKEVKETAAVAKEMQSGVHGLAEFMRAGLMEVHSALGKIAEKVEDVPQIREQLDAAKEQIEQLSRDVRRMDVPRTEATNPPEPPITPEGD